MIDYCIRMLNCHWRKDDGADEVIDYCIRILNCHWRTDDGADEVIDEEEYRIFMELKDAKKLYREVWCVVLACRGVGVCLCVKCVGLWGVYVWCWLKGCQGSSPRGASLCVCVVSHACVPCMCVCLGRWPLIVPDPTNSATSPPS